MKKAFKWIAFLVFFAFWFVLLSISLQRSDKDYSMHLNEESPRGQRMREYKAWGDSSNQEAFKKIDWSQKFSEWMAFWNSDHGKT
jgi:hypothetical protein